MIVILSGPSGSGKTTLAKLLGILRPSMHRPVSYTTRQLKKGEINGVDYHFISRAVFEKRIARGDFAEYAEYGGEFYGTLKLDLKLGLSALDDCVVLLEIDLQGMRQIKKGYSGVRTIFIHPPTKIELERRIRERQRGESEEEITRRLTRADEELACASECDFEIVNTDRHTAIREINRIINLPMRVEV